MRVADYIAKRLSSMGIDTCFMLTGGGAMHLNDALGCETRMRKVFCHHEQALSMAAESYARIAEKPAVVNVTTGPGAINAMNGVFGAFTDSIPMLVISGQVKRETSLSFNEVHGLRQLGDQEVDTVAMASPITKWCRLVRTPEEVPALMEQAYLQAVSGRPGPVWLDLPIDVQGAQIADSTLVEGLPVLSEPEALPDEIAERVLDEIRRASRPVVIAGSGIRIGGATTEFLALAETLGLPVTTAWAHDIIASDHPLFAGRPGTIGTRAGNFVVQNADCVLILGSRLNIRQVSYNWTGFARNANKIWVDIDAAELQKPFVRPDLAIHSHLLPFIASLSKAAKRARWTPRHALWLQWCKRIGAQYTPNAADYPVKSDCINPYHFADALFQQIESGDVVACGDATATIVPFQIAKLRHGVRMFSNSGSASMGYDLPAAIGAAVARPDARVVCLAGDGSLMMNIQELQTISSLRLRIKICVLDNDGYLSIKQTQRNFFGRENGSSPASGLTFPNFRKVALAFGLPTIELDPSSWRHQLAEFLREDGPGLCVVPLDIAQEFEPRLKSRMVDGVIQTPELDDMYPFLCADELEAVRYSALAIESSHRESSPTPPPLRPMPTPAE